MEEQGILLLESPLHATCHKHVLGLGGPGLFSPVPPVRSMAREDESIWDQLRPLLGLLYLTGCGWKD